MRDGTGWLELLWQLFVNIRIKKFKRIVFFSFVQLCRFAEELNLRAPLQVNTIIAKSLKKCLQPKLANITILSIISPNIICKTMLHFYSMLTLIFWILYMSSLRKLFFFFFCSLICCCFWTNFFKIIQSRTNSSKYAENNVRAEIVF